jgi:hypothetical protein
MLRNALIGIGTVALLCGLIAIATGAFPPAFVFAFWGAVLVAGIVFERVIYKRTLDRSPGPGWQRTTERFVDDATGLPVTVYIEPASGERAYVQE